MDILGIKEYILSYLKCRELMIVRTINKYYKDLVSNTSISDYRFNIINAELFHKIFKKPITVRLEQNCEFFQFETIKCLILRRCGNASDEIFENLPRLCELDIYNCGQITDKAFKNLRILEDLSISGYYKITNKAFENLENLKYLEFYMLKGAIIPAGVLKT